MADPSSLSFTELFRINPWGLTSVCTIPPIRYISRARVLHYPTRLATVGPSGSPTRRCWCSTVVGALYATRMASDTHTLRIISMMPNLTTRQFAPEWE